MLKRKKYDPTRPLSKLDNLQVRAFRSMFRWSMRDEDLSVEEAFVRAICATSDDAFAKANPVLIKEWLEKHGQKQSIVC